MSGPRRRRAGPVGGLIVLRAVAAALAVVAGLALPTATASAQGAPGLQLAGQSSWVGPEGEFVLSVRAVAPGASLSVRVYPAVTGRIRFDQSTRGENLGSPLRPLVPDLPLDALPRDPDGAVTLSFPVTAGTPGLFGVRLTESGVYPVAITVVDAAGEPVDELVTHLVRLPGPEDPAVPLAVAVVAPVTAPIAHAPTGETALPAEEGVRLDQLAATLGEWGEVPLTFEITPETLDALASVERQGGPPTVTRLRAALPGRQVLARPYVDLDWGAWVDEGDPAELANQLTAGGDTLVAHLGTRPDPASWTVDPSLTPDALTWLREAGARRVAVPTGQLDPSGADAGGDPVTETFAVEDGSGAEVAATAIDDELAARLVQTDDPVLNAHLALADLAVLHGYAPNATRGTAVRLPDAEVPTATLDAFLDGLADPTGGTGAGGVVTPVTLDGLFTRATVATTGRDQVVVRAYDADASGTLDSLPERAPPVREQLDGFRSMLGEDPTPAVPMERSFLIAGARGLDDLERQAYLAGVVQGVERQVAGVSLPDQQQVTLTSESGNLPLSLDNTLDYPVTVVVRLRSDKLAFPQGAEQTVVLPPGPTRLEFAVEAKASGAFPLEVEVRSPDQVLLVGESDLTVRSTAFSGLGLLLSVAAGLFLLVWWARHFRNVRRNRLLVGSGHPSLRSRAHDTAGTATDPGPPRASATLAATAEPGRTEGEHARSPHRHR